MNQPPPPVMIDIRPPVEDQAEGLVDLLIGALGLVGGIVVAALVVGAIVGGVLFWLRSDRGLSRRS